MASHHTEQSPTLQAILIAVSTALRIHEIPPTRFGRMAVNDPRFVFDLRNGREIRPSTERRVRAFIASLGGGHGE